MLYLIKLFNLIVNFLFKKSEPTQPALPPVQQIQMNIMPVPIAIQPPPTMSTNLFVLPPRTGNVITGTEFVQMIMNVPPNQQREDMIFAQVQAGNIPDFMRNPIELTVTAGSNVLKYQVLPEVLCVGTNEDYLRTPLNPLTAKKVADLCNATLPTTKMAHQIWQAASVKLTPSPNGPPYDNSMQSTKKLWDHEQRIRTQLTGVVPGQLISGHKKDVIVSPALFAYPGNVGIFGWFQVSGAPIQPLNCVSHSKIYWDYSHGIRLINKKCILNGQQYDIYDILADHNLCSLISSEGPFDARSIYTK